MPRAPFVPSFDLTDACFGSLEGQERRRREGGGGGRERGDLGGDRMGKIGLGEDRADRLVRGLGERQGSER